MQIDQIETFLDLFETRSFHQSSERLGVTKSTVSARLAALEAALGAKLFTRSRAGTQPTPEGMRFAPHARMLRHEWHQARRRILIPSHAAHLVRIGIQNDLSALYLGGWVAEFRRTAPDTAFYIEPDYSNQMCMDLLAGTLDFALRRGMGQAGDFPVGGKQPGFARVHVNRRNFRDFDVFRLVGGVAACHSL